MRRQAAEMFHAGELSPHDISRIASTDFRPGEGLTDNHGATTNE